MQASELVDAVRMRLLDLPASAVTSGTQRVETSLLLVSLVPCLHYRFVFGCVVGSVGALRGAALRVDRPTPESSVYAAMGGRVGVEVGIVKFFAIVAHEVSVAVHRHLASYDSTRPLRPWLFGIVALVMTIRDEHRRGLARALEINLTSRRWRPGSSAPTTSSDRG